MTMQTLKPGGASGAWYLAVLLVASSTVALSGCTVNQLSAEVLPGAHLPSTPTFHVVTLDADARHIDELIKQRLIAMGYIATAGPKVSVSTVPDVFVTYKDKWMWDMSMYMMELTITFRNPKSDFPLAEGHALHGSLSRRTPEEMVDEVLSEMLRKMKEGS